ncbi:MAG: TMEM175 family protein [Candidatus Baltobacteraceae bacterium]
MEKNRLEAFSDGVIAVIITIMVLELRAPLGVDLHSLVPVLPTFLIYVLSFIFVGIYWNNHHHLFRAVKHIDGQAMWANLHLLFWLSLVPFVTTWMGENHFAAVPTALYGVVLVMAAFAFTILLRTLVAIPENRSLASAVGNDSKGKISLAIYAAAIPLAFLSPWISDALYILVALIWLIPDRRIERRVAAD